MSSLKRWLKRLRSRAGQSATEYVLVISVLSIAAMAATSSFQYAYICMFTGQCGSNNTGGVPQQLADSLTQDGIQGVGNGQ